MELTVVAGATAHAQVTLAYFVVGLSIPVFITALVALASGLLFALTATLGVGGGGRGLVTLLTLPVVAGIFWLVGRLAAARAGRAPPAETPVSLDRALASGLGPEVLGAKAHTLAALGAAGVPVLPGWVLPAGAASPRAVRRLHRRLTSTRYRDFLVRSSFGAEGAGGRAAPGVFDSLPWSRADGAAGLAEVIDRVRASASSARARAYLGDAPAPSLAVLVNPLLSHHEHGLASSADPITGAPERHRVDLAAGPAEHDLLTDQVHGPTRRDDLVRRVSRLAGRVECALGLGAPVEIEWGLADQGLVVHQARPLSPAASARTWTNSFGVEVPRRALSETERRLLFGEDPPARLLDGQLRRLGLPGVADDQVRLIDGCPYVDARALEPILVGAPVQPRLRVLVRIAWVFARALVLLRRPDLPAELPADLATLREAWVRPMLEAEQETLVVAGLCDGHPGWLVRRARRRLLADRDALGASVREVLARACRAAGEVPTSSAAAAPPRLVEGPDGVMAPPPSPLPAEPDLLAHGVGASPGRGRGLAIRLGAPADQAGELEVAGRVLVVADPSPDHGPLVGDAAAIVLETGGPLSHLAALGRELGVPVVAATGPLPEPIDDVLLEVDGATGSVRRC